MVRFVRTLLLLASWLSFVAPAVAADPDSRLEGSWRVVARKPPENEFLESLARKSGEPRAIARAVDGPSGIGTGLSWSQYTLSFRGGEVTAEAPGSGSSPRRDSLEFRDGALMGMPSMTAATYRCRTGGIYDRGRDFLDVIPGEHVGSSFKRFTAIYSVTESELTISIYTEQSLGGQLVERLHFVRQRDTNPRGHR
jgi:hypothetical protein